MNISFFDALIRSCTDFKFYKEVVFQPFGKTLKYLLLLSVFATLAIGVRYSFAINKFVREGLKWVEQNVPRIEIIDGAVKVNAEQPFIKKHEEYAFIIDTTEQVKEIGKEYKSGFLLTKDKLIVKSDEFRTQEFELKKIKNFILDKAMLEKWKKFLVFILVPFMVALQFFYFIFAKVIQFLLTGLAIMVARPTFKFTNILNICIYALTPVTVLGLIVTISSTKPIPFFWMIYMGMYIAFIIGGLNQCSAEPEAK
jgi:hypothetical protein